MEGLEAWLLKQEGCELVLKGPQDFIIFPAQGSLILFPSLPCQ